MTDNIRILLADLNCVDLDADRLKDISSAAQNVHYQAVTGLEWIARTLTTIECCADARKEFDAGHGIDGLGDLILCLAILADKASEIDGDASYLLAQQRTSEPSAGAKEVA